MFIFVVNLLGVRVFGELEFWFSGIKGQELFHTLDPHEAEHNAVVTLIGLLFMGIVIDLGGNPMHDRLGFRYWKSPNGPMGEYLLSQVHDTSTSIFLGFWATLTNALFACKLAILGFGICAHRNADIGTELIGVTVGEAENPRKNIPQAIRRTFWRIVIFYVSTQCSHL